MFMYRFCLHMQQNVDKTAEFSKMIYVNSVRELTEFHIIYEYRVGWLGVGFGV